MKILTHLALYTYFLLQNICFLVTKFSDKSFGLLEKLYYSHFLDKRFILLGKARSFSIKNCFVNKSLAFPDKIKNLFLKNMKQFSPHCFHLALVYFSQPKVINGKILGRKFKSTEMYNFSQLKR